MKPSWHSRDGLGVVWRVHTCSFASILKQSGTSQNFISNDDLQPDATNLVGFRLGRVQLQISNTNSNTTNPYFQIQTQIHKIFDFLPYFKIQFQIQGS